MSKKSGRTSRTKGHSFEREIARILKSKNIFPEARRHLEYQDGSANGVDLSSTGNLRIQCKRGKRYAPLTKIQEIKDPSGYPILITKADHQPIMVGMYFADFIKILQDIGEAYV